MKIHLIDIRNWSLPVCEDEEKSNILQNLLHDWFGLFVYPSPIKQNLDYFKSDPPPELYKQLRAMLMEIHIDAEDEVIVQVYHQHCLCIMCNLTNTHFQHRYFVAYARSGI